MLLYEPFWGGTHRIRYYSNASGLCILPWSDTGTHCVAIVVILDGEARRVLPYHLRGDTLPLSVTKRSVGPGLRKCLAEFRSITICFAVFHALGPLPGPPGPPGAPSLGPLGSLEPPGPPGAPSLGPLGPLARRAVVYETFLRPARAIRLYSRAWARHAFVYEAFWRPRGAICFYTSHSGEARAEYATIVTQMDSASYPGRMWGRIALL